MDNKKYFILGLNNSLSILSSNNKLIKSIFIMKNSIASKNEKINKYLKYYNDKIFYLSREEFEKKYDFKRSQGIVINLSSNVVKNINNCDFSKKQLCYIILDQINDPQNLGQIIRTCECAGIDGIILPKHGSVHITNTVLQVSQGAFVNIDLFIVTNINETIKDMKKEGFWVIGVENSIDAKQWYEMDYKDKICIVFGSEGKGMRSLVKKSCDFMATIPMLGKINSLNVSATISAIIFERQRQLSIKKID